MRKVTLVFAIFAALFLGNNLFAQGKYGADSAECIKYLSYYKEYYKQKAYDEAVPSWRKAYSICPATSSQNLLIDGTTLVRRLITKNAKNAQYKQALIDTLLTLHDTRAQYYPKYAVTAMNNKGTDMSNYIKDDSKRLFDGYEQIIEANKDQTKATLLLFDLQALIDLYSQGQVDAETVINIYQRNNDILESMNPKNDAEKEQNSNVKNDMGSLFAASKVASCDELIALYTPRYEADPDNLALATSIVKTMNITDDCNSNDLFLKAVTTMYKLEPSAASAYYLYKLHAAKSNVDDAIRYMEEAINSEETDAEKDNEYKYELATFCFKNGQNIKAYENASAVAESSTTLNGKAYFLIANIWGAVRCGGDEIAKRAPYWVACDYLNKAKAADPTLAEEANRMIGQYSAYFPQAAEAFMYDITNGQSYTVSCGGLRATTTVRTTK
ncbi:MAG: hypothetical protein Q4D10_01455 [Bacteroidales bacterium]|nr:hypothetical protein [Bacteroidales bacterium]MDO4212787.1 hypothetical protein [Bacteroidales bacterium]